MKLSKYFALSLILSSLGAQAAAPSILDQWHQGLSGAKLTAYDGSVTRNNSTLTVIRFCHDGRYHYSKEGGWYVPGTAAGASKNHISGQWNVQQQGFQTLLVYQTDGGEQGAFPIYLQNNGRVNIGGTAYAVEKGNAGC